MAIVKARGEPDAVLDEMWEKVTLDFREATAWKFCEDFMNGRHAEGGERAEEPVEFFAEWSQEVKVLLERVSRRTSPAEFLLQRMVDCHTYPSMETESVRTTAAAVLRKLSANVDVPGMSDAGECDDVGAAVRALRLLMSARTLTLAQVAEQLALVGPEGRVKASATLAVT